MTATWTWSIDAAIGDAIYDETDDPILDATDDPIRDNGWLSLTEDVIAQGETIEWNQGIGGAGMTDLVSQSGTLTFTLDNSEVNSAGALGAYSFGHANVRTDEWKRGAQVRIGIEYGGDVEYWMFYVINCEPSAGAFGDRKVVVTASDWISRAALTGISKLSVQTGQRPDQVLQTLINAAASPPVNYVLNTETQTVFAYALHGEQDEKTRLLTVLQKIAQSSGGAIFVDSDATHGETLRYEPRTMRPMRSVVASFNDTMTEVEVSWPEEDVIDQVKITYNPGKVDTVNVVLAEITQEIRLAPGEVRAIDLRYRDPNGLSNRVSALSVAAQVAGTDIKASSIERDGGTDLSSSLIVSLVAGANSASASLYNSAAVTMYVNTFQIQGKGLYLYDPLSYVEGSDDPLHPFDYSAPYMSEYWDAKNYAELLYGRMSDNTRPNVGKVGFYADYDDTFFGYLLNGHIGQPYTLTETVTGLSTRKFYINKRSMRIERGTLYVEWLGEPADRYTYLQCDASHALDDATKVLA